MLARNAEALYWIGRYVERADDTARILDVTVHQLLEDSSVDPDRASRILLELNPLVGGDVNRPVAAVEAQGLGMNRDRRGHENDGQGRLLQTRKDHGLGFACGAGAAGCVVAGALAGVDGAVSFGLIVSFAGPRKCTILPRSERSNPPLA